MRVREALAPDAPTWERMRRALWPEEEAGEHAAEIAAYFAGEFPRGPWLALIAVGCTEFASDADPANAVSIDAHLALGFEDAGLVRCFRKSLGD